MIGRLAAGARVVLATHNAGKLRELAALLAPHGVAGMPAGTLGLAEPAETETSFLGNAGIKARAAAVASGLPALADDSGFSVAALGGDPGVRTADWAMRPDGARDYAMAMGEVARRAGARDAARRAWFSCALVLAWPDGTTRGFEGRVDGAWVWPPRGERGFGYDGMFVPAGGALTFGELDPGAKHAIGHRARAFADFSRACLPDAGPALGAVVDRLAGWAAGVGVVREVVVLGRDTLAAGPALPVWLRLESGLSAADAVTWGARCAAELADPGFGVGFSLADDGAAAGVPVLRTGKVTLLWAGGL